MSEKRSLNDRFTDIADKISEKLGTWQFFAFCFLMLLVWVSSGPSMHFSDTWQLVANTPTTWIELFQEIIILAAANRIEKRNRGLQEHQEVVLEKIESIEEQHDRMLNHLTELEAQNLVLLTKMTAVHKTTVLEIPKKERK